MCQRRFFGDCALEFGLRELTGYKLYQPSAWVRVRHDCSPINIFAPCGGSLFSITSESARESDCGAHNAVAIIRTRLHADSDVSGKLAVWLPCDDVIKPILIRGPGTVECTKRASLGNGRTC